MVFREREDGYVFFNDTATTEIYSLSLHDALPISEHLVATTDPDDRPAGRRGRGDRIGQPGVAKPGEVLSSVLAPGQNDQVGVLDLRRAAHEPHAHAGLTRQRLPVGEGGDPGRPSDP